MTFTIWWDVWKHDALWVVAYCVALLICFGASIFGVIVVGAAKYLRRR